MKRNTVFLLGLLFVCFFAMPASADLIGVTGPNSSAGTAPSIIGAPTNILDDNVENTGMQGFDEVDNFTTTLAHQIDGGGFIPVGTTVDSHMIFLNSAGTARLEHFSVVWTFRDPIIGVMSDSGGNFEAASTFELGNPTTNYPIAAFNARGLEANDGVGDGDNDGYAISSDMLSITVGMVVTEPGDWIRVVTTAQSVPEPGSLLLLGIGLIGIAGLSRKRFQK
jgi:hypothetical protein